MSVEVSRVDRVDVRRRGPGWEGQVFELGNPRPIWTARALTLQGVVMLIEEAYPAGAVRATGREPI